MITLTLVLGCSHNRAQRATAPFVRCIDADIFIGNFRGDLGGRATWQATCNSITYQCQQSEPHQVECQKAGAIVY